MPRRLTLDFTGHGTQALRVPGRLSIIICGTTVEIMEAVLTTRRGISLMGTTPRSCSTSLSITVQKQIATRETGTTTPYARSMEPIVRWSRDVHSFNQD